MNIQTKIALKKYQDSVRENSRKRVKDAIDALIERNETIGFSSVSKECGLSRKTLYKVQEFKELINIAKKEKNEEVYENELFHKEKLIKKLQKENEDLRLLIQKSEKFKSGLEELRMILKNI